MVQKNISDLTHGILIIVADKQLLFPHNWSRNER